MAGVHCPQCHTKVDLAGPAATPLTFACPRCGTASTVYLLPSLTRGPVVGRAGAASTGEDATCFFHLDKRAEAACDQCGRYICALCDLQVGDRHLCPSCFNARSRTAGAPPAHTERFRTLPAKLGLWIGAVSLLFWPISIVGGPAAIFFGVRGLRRPGSITGRRTTVAGVMAIVLGAIEITLWVTIVTLIVIGIRRGAR